MVTRSEAFNIRSPKWAYLREGSIRKGMNEAKESPVIQVTQLCKRYRIGEETIAALDGVDLAIEHNELVGIMGPSGSGKSTLMNVLGCLVTPDAGCYRLNAREVSTFDDDELADMRCQAIGYIFQSFNLQSRRTALDNVMMPLRFGTVPKSEWRERAVSLLQRVGLDRRIDHRPTQLSGGQQQRVAIARALVNNPSVLLADEPTGNLDSRTTDDIMALLKQLHAEGQTIIVVTHDNEIARHTHRVVSLHDGRISGVRENTQEHLS